jgi:hypothetical protein
VVSVAHLFSAGQDPDNLDFEALLINVIEKHTKAVLKAFQLQLQRLAVFAPPGIVSLVKDGTFSFPPPRSPSLTDPIHTQEISTPSKPIS